MIPTPGILILEHMDEDGVPPKSIPLAPLLRAGTCPLLTLLEPPSPSPSISGLRLPVLGPCYSTPHPKQARVCLKQKSFSNYL